MGTMQRRHLEIIADIIKGLPDQAEGTPLTRPLIARHFAAHLSLHTDNFKDDRFMKACGEGRPETGAGRKRGSKLRDPRDPRDSEDRGAVRSLQGVAEQPVVWGADEGEGAREEEPGNRMHLVTEADLQWIRAQQELLDEMRRERDRARNRRMAMEMVGGILVVVSLIAMLYMIAALLQQ